MPATTGQVATAQEAGRPQPQTTYQAAGGPFVRHAREGRAIQYAITGTAFSGAVSQPLPAKPGYMRALRMRVALTGSSASTSVAVAADGPWIAQSLVQFYDAFGTPLFVGDGFDLFLVNKYGGQFVGGLGLDPGNSPVFVAVTSASGASAGNLTYSLSIPAEVANAIGTLSLANAALQPRLQITYNTAANTYAAGTTPGTAGTFETDLDADFYWLPDIPIEPPGLGTTCQWIKNQGSPTVASASNTTVTLPREGGYLGTIILLMRDSSGVRIDPWGTRLQWIVDGIPILDTRFDLLKEDIWIQYAGFGGGNTGAPSRETGVLPISNRTSFGRSILGALADTGEKWLSTSPGTSLAVQSVFGTITNSPATLNILAGQVVPAGSLVVGLPEA